MATKITIDAQLREATGKNEMRRLRRSGQIPGVIFGRSGETFPVSFDGRELEKVLHSPMGFNAVFTIKVKGAKEDYSPLVIVKDYQLEPVSHDFLHVSFYRIHMDREVELTVPIHLTGEAKGVKDHGGTLDHIKRELNIRCLPGVIPDAIHIEVTDMQIGDYVRLSDLEIAEGVTVLEEDPEAVVLHLAPPKRVVEEVEALEEGAEVAEGEEEPAEAAQGADEQG